MAAIGIFDSGLGGLSVWKEIVRLLPDTRLIYVADQARCPYGPQAPEHIRQYSHQITKFLIGQGCEMVVLACNTATAAAISTLRKTYNLPFVGMEPALKPAAIQTKSGHIGILATAGTFKGDHFKRTKAAFGKGVHIHLLVEERLVEIVENGLIETPETTDLLERLLIPVLDKGIDQLVLGCTHYPFLIPSIEKIVQGRAGIIDPSPAVALQVERLWKESGHHSLQNSGGYFHFFTSGDKYLFNRQLPELLGDHFPGLKSAVIGKW